MNLWMSPAETLNEPYIAVYRCRFTLEAEEILSFRFSADERAQIFLDGRRIADGAGTRSSGTVVLSERNCPCRMRGTCPDGTGDLFREKTACLCTDVDPSWIPY